MSDSEAEGGIPLIEPEFDANTESKKRKRDPAGDSKEESKAERKKAKRKQKKAKLKAIDNDQLDEELSVNHAFEHMDSQLLADYINQRTRLYGKELSTVELEDRFFPSQ